MSRITNSESSPKVHSSSSMGDGVGTAGTGSEQEQSSASPQPRYSEASDGYPSWLPKRPPPPAPASTFHSSAPSVPYLVQGRKPTPRSVRIISTQESERREPTDQTRMSSGNALHQRAWSRATGAGMSPTVLGSINGAPVPRPRFRSSALHLELLKSPSLWMKLQFYVLPFFVFAHIPLQTFFDLNAVFILIE